MYILLLILFMLQHLSCLLAGSPVLPSQSFHFFLALFVSEEVTYFYDGKIVLYEVETKKKKKKLNRCLTDGIEDNIFSTIFSHILKLSCI